MRKTHMRSGKSARWVQLLSVGLMGVAISFLPPLSISAAQAAKPQTGQQSQTRQQSLRPLASAPRTNSASTRTMSAAPRGAVASRHAAAAHGKRGAQHAKNGKMRVARYGGGLQCVPFARNASGIEVSGNAHTWWDNAAGTYARGHVPERGSVLSFRANHSMPLGHVAVVSQMINARTLEIDHANWAGPGGRTGSIARGVSGVDVSDSNNWTAVRVALGQSGDYGSIYPANGFIYDRPERGGVAIAANTRAPAPMPELNAAPRDLRPTGGAASTGYASVAFADGAAAFEEVAEAPVSPRRAVASPRRKVQQRVRH